MRPPVVRSSHAKRLMLAGRLAAIRLGLDPDARCEIIAGAARTAFTAAWLGDARRPVTWDWARMTIRFQNDHPKCFNAAIWHGDRLCGLAIGAVNRDRFVAVDYLEGDPDPAHPLKGRVIPIVLTMAEAYRVLIGVPELRLHDVAPALIPLYERQGFALAPDLGGAHHMRRR